MVGIAEQHGLVLTEGVDVDLKALALVIEAVLGLAHFLKLGIHLKQVLVVLLL